MECLDFTPKKCLPPRSSVSTPRTSDGTRRREGPGSEGAPRKPPSHGKKAVDSMRGIAIDFESSVGSSSNSSSSANAGSHKSTRRVGLVGTLRASKSAMAWGRLSDEDFGDEQFEQMMNVCATPETKIRPQSMAFSEGEGGALTPITGDLVVEDSPDPCSKFHSGPGPVAISPMTPGGPAVKVPLIYGSNVTMDSPDPCSKFHTGPGPVPISPMTPGAPVAAWTCAVSSSTSLASTSAVVAANNMPLIYGSNVSVDSPDPCSKFHAGPGPAVEKSGKISAAEAVVQKLWRHSASVQDAENSRAEREQWKLSRPVGALPQHASSSSSSLLAIPRAGHRSVMSPDDSLFNQTVSPLKPNYKAICQSIQSGVPAAKSSSAPAARFVRRVSPQPVSEADIFKNTLSPFKCEDYEAIRGQINTGKIDFGSSPLTKKVPVRPAVPPPREVAGADGSDAARPFRRNFSGRDVANVVSPVHEPAPAAAAVMKSAMSPSRQAPPPRAREATVQHADKENDAANNSNNSNNSSSTSSSSSGDSGSRGFRRGRTLKPAQADTESSCDSPFHVIEQFEASLQAKKAPVRPQVPPRRGAARVRVSSLVCCYSRRQASRKKKASKHGRRGGGERLESIPEEHLALFGGYPVWLDSVCLSEE